MAQGVTIDLVWAAFWVGLLGLIVASYDLPFPMALFVSGVKIAIPFVYFAWFYDGGWNFLDDFVYQSMGTEMLQFGYTPITALVNPEGIQHLVALSGGIHIFYAWWNLLGQYFFGEHYYSPVFLNVGLTFVGGYFFLRIIYTLGFRRVYAQTFLVFFLLHFDILLWSSFINMKDVIVLTLSIISFFIIILLTDKLSIFYIFSLFFISFLLIWLRFYIPIIIIASVVCWMIEENSILSAFIIKRLNFPKKYVIVPFIFLFGFISIIYTIGLDMILSYVKKIDAFSINIIYGVVRLYLTPRPWAIESEYSFLMLPSVIHLVLLIPSVYGGFLLWKNSKETRLVLIYLFIVILIYGSYSEIQGVRQRFQIVWIIAWMQFHSLWVVAKGAAGYTKIRQSA